MELVKPFDESRISAAVLRIELHVVLWPEACAIGILGRDDDIANFIPVSVRQPPSNLAGRL
jgi:hypothetical protein